MAKVAQYECEGVRIMVETTVEFNNFVDPWVCGPDGAISTLCFVQQQPDHRDHLSWHVTYGGTGV